MGSREQRLHAGSDGDLGASAQGHGCRGRWRQGSWATCSWGCGNTGLHDPFLSTQPFDAHPPASIGSQGLSPLMATLIQKS